MAFDMPSSHHRETVNKDRTVGTNSLSSYSYSNVTLFTICVQTVGLVTAYLLGIVFHYDSLMKTHCNVRQHIMILPVTSMLLLIIFERPMAYINSLFCIALSR